jgi:hypothetical protein
MPIMRKGVISPRGVSYLRVPAKLGTRKEVSTLRKLSTRKLIASAFAGIILGVGVPFAGADAGGGPGSNHGCPGHQPPPPPNHSCGK